MIFEGFWVFKKIRKVVMFKTGIGSIFIQQNQVIISELKEFLMKSDLKVVEVTQESLTDFINFYKSNLSESEASFFHPSRFEKAFKFGKKFYFVENQTGERVGTFSIDARKSRSTPDQSLYSRVTYKMLFPEILPELGGLTIAKKYRLRIDGKPSQTPNNILLGRIIAAAESSAKKMGITKVNVMISADNANWRMGKERLKKGVFGYAINRTLTIRQNSGATIRRIVNNALGAKIPKRKWHILSKRLK